MNFCEGNSSCNAAAVYPAVVDKRPSKSARKAANTLTTTLGTLDRDFKFQTPQQFLKPFSKHAKIFGRIHRDFLSRLDYWLHGNWRCRHRASGYWRFADGDDFRGRSCLRCPL